MTVHDWPIERSSRGKRTRAITRDCRKVLESREELDFEMNDRVQKRELYVFGIKDRG